MVPASPDNRQNLKDVAKEIANDMDFSADLIIFFHRDHIHGWIQDHPGILLKHFDYSS